MANHYTSLYNKAGGFLFFPNPILILVTLDTTYGSTAQTQTPECHLHRNGFSAVEHVNGQDEDPTKRKTTGIV